MVLDFKVKFWFIFKEIFECDFEIIKLENNNDFPSIKNFMDKDILNHVKAFRKFFGEITDKTLLIDTITELKKDLV